MSRLLHLAVGFASGRHRERTLLMAGAMPAALVLSLVCSCASSETSGTCTPATTRACQCSQGGNGTQTCKNSGVWGACTNCTTGNQDGATKDTGSSQSDVGQRDGVRPPDGKKDTGPRKDRPPSRDLCSDICGCGQASGQLTKSSSPWSPTVGGQSVSVKVTDFGSSGGKPSAFLSVDGSSQIVRKGDTVLSPNDVRVYCSDIDSASSPYPTWVKVCVAYP
jgi:hypothetical protein